MGLILKILIIVVGVGLILLLLRRVLIRRQPPPSPSQDLTHQMVQCAHCGLHVPQSGAIHDGVRSYCSDVHRRAGAKI